MARTRTWCSACWRQKQQGGTRAVIVSGLLDFPIVIIFLFTGILLYVFYQYNPANLPADTPQLHVFPYFIIHELPNGIRGLLIAGLLATAMGSLSTALNSLATTATKDWYQGIFKPEATERQLLRCVRWGTAVSPCCSSSWVPSQRGMWCITRKSASSK